MDHHVVASTEERETFDIGRAAAGPRDEMVSIEMLDLVAAREGACGVSQPQSATLSTRCQTL